MSIIQSISCEGVNWLSDFPYISAKTNSGKTTFAILEAREFVERQTGNRFDYVILLTPYKRTRKQILNDERFKGRVVELNASVFDSDFKTEKVIVGTYAKLCNLIEQNQIDLDKTLVIFDELHTFIGYTRYQPQMAYLVEQILNPETWKAFVALGMTGTPKILDYCESMPFEFKDITPIAEINITCDEGLFIRGGSAESYARLLIAQGLTGAKLFYVNGASQCYRIAKTFNNAGYTAAFVVSSYHDKSKDENDIPLGEAMELQTFNGLSITDWLDERSNVPDELDILVINASGRDGINILDELNRFDEVVIESADKSTIEQARSRIRHDLPQLTVIYNSRERRRSFENLKESIEFFRGYEVSNSKEKLLASRFVRQMQNDDLDCIVLSGTELFVNPFIKALISYDLQNYEFSKYRTYIDESGFAITEHEQRIFNGRVLDTFTEWKNELKPLIDGRRFVDKSGDEIRQQILELELKEKALNLIELDSWYNVEQVKELAAKIDFKDASKSTKWGKDKLLNELPRIICGLNIFPRKMPHKDRGTNSQHYCFSFNERAPRKKKNEPIHYHLDD